MGAALLGGPLTITSTAQKLTTLLGYAEKKFLANLLLRAAEGNSDAVWFGKSNVTPTTNQMGYIKASEGLAIDLSAFTNTDELYLVAASTQIVYATGVS